MKTFKIIILMLSVIITSSCSPREIEPTCECETYGYVSLDTGMVYKFNRPYRDMECMDGNYTYSRSINPDGKLAFPAIKDKYGKVIYPALATKAGWVKMNYRC